MKNDFAISLEKRDLLSTIDRSVMGVNPLNLKKSQHVFHAAVFGGSVIIGFFLLWLWYERVYHTNGFSSPLISLMPGAALTIYGILGLLVLSVLRPEGGSVDGQQVREGKTFEDMVASLLGEYEISWQEELELRNTLLYAPDAPLREEQLRYEATYQTAYAAYNETYATATAERDQEYAAAIRDRDREYATATAERDQEYAAAYAERESTYAEVMKSTDPRRSAAYRKHLQRRSAAYRKHLQRRSEAYNRYLRRRSEAYSKHQNCCRAALRERYAAERAAAAKREEAVQVYLASHQLEDVGQHLDTIGHALSPQNDLAFSLVQVLSVPALIEQASDIVDGRRVATDLQVAAVAANLRNYVERSVDDDPYPELRDRALELLRNLIKRLN